MTSKEEADILADIARRHSSLHTVSNECAKAMRACIAMLDTCYEHGLQAENKAVADALSALHAAAKAKWQAK